MTQKQSSYTLVDTQMGLRRAVSTLTSASVLAVDTEADSRHRYPEKVCLIQLSDGENTFLIDTLSGLNYREIGDLLADRHAAKVMHGADFDIRGLNRDFGFTFSTCYDTSIAARFAGIERVGLASLLEEVLGVSILKDHRLQRADWSRRPLEDEALDYAAADVAYLVDLKEALDLLLRNLGRDIWVTEEFDRLAGIRYLAPDRETAFLSVKGSRYLDGRGLAVLKALYEFREAEAHRLNRPPGYVLSAAALISLAADPDIRLADVPGVGPAIVRRFGGAIRAALKAGQESPPIERLRPLQPSLPRPTPAQSARLAGLKRWRLSLGEKLTVDASILWPMRSLERLARDGNLVEEETRSSDVRQWQVVEFAESLRRYLGSKG